MGKYTVGILIEAILVGILLYRFRVRSRKRTKSDQIKLQQELCKTTEMKIILAELQEKRNLVEDFKEAFTWRKITL